MAAAQEDALGPMMNAVNWALTALAGIFLGLRIYCKFSRHRGLWWDDQILIFAFACLVAAVGFITSSISLGFTSPAGPQTPEAALRLQIHGGVQNVLFGLATVMSKTSFGVTLLRVTEGKMKMLVLFLTITMNLAVFLYIIFTFLKCKPEIYSWIKGPGCWSTAKYIHYGIFAGAYSAFVDFSFAIIPWFLIMNLQMRRREKLGVAIAMSCGVIAGITAVMRCIYLPLLTVGTFSTQGTTLVIWYVAEAAVTIIAASIPVLRALIKDISSSLDRYNRSTGNKSGLKSHTKNTPRGLHASNVVTTVVSSRRNAHDPHDPHGDAGSDISILEGAHAPGKSSTSRGGIVQTQEIRLSYHERSDNESEQGYEMESMGRKSP
ncbi:hypothetical protein F4774DRAFT_400038 [Daldinia eschscholtzii]|uniref:Decarboxylase_GME103 n=1 Tax=Daldinia eschscholzii IFB-TL01 TaxID=1169046 RepID=A0A0X9F6X6_9PEZI|nr:decarboxylase_GME103 [Daldinia eschscholzii IFB-TL01]KAI1474592.1 hypothetical protein F4774DRAFT_400038 [Daldinia eschscholtzii]